MTVTDIPLAIFDLDGTLVDSRRIIAHAMDRAFDAVGLPPPGFERTRHIVGLSLDDACAVMLGPDCPQAQLAALAAGYHQAFVDMKDSAEFLEPLYEGARELLEDLRAAGWKIAAATGKTRAGVAQLFARKQLHAFFDAVGCADDGPGKPHPAMVHKVLAELSVAPAGAILIGDTHWDMTMAKAAGVAALGVSWGFHRSGEIAAAGPAAIHDDFASLKRDLLAFAPAPRSGWAGA